jgi:alpha-tubulin suppressor-like RCC1 family protein
MSRYTPSEVADGGTIDWREVSVAANFACATDAQGALYCWGDGRYGQRGDGTSVRWLPAAVPKP